MSRGLAVMLLAMLTGGSAMAESVCTQMGCQSGLQLDVAPDYPWSPGAYFFDFNLDGAHAVCRGVLPLPPCEQSGLTCDNAAITVLQSGCAMLPENHGFGNIMIDGAPAKVRVTITRDGAQLVDKTFAPKYHDIRPNGAQCEPVCRQASARLLGQ
ncbi:MAG: hypothetical protein WBK91_00890 [Alphaproteobacteria bacterium]